MERHRELLDEYERLNKRSGVLFGLMALSGVCLLLLVVLQLAPL